MAASKRKPAKRASKTKPPGPPDLTEVSVQVAGGQFSVETMDTIWNWVPEGPFNEVPGVALRVVSSFTLTGHPDADGETAGLDEDDLDSLIAELIKARDIIRARKEIVGGAYHKAVR